MAEVLLADHVSKAESLGKVLNVSLDVAKVLLKEYDGNVDLAANEVISQRRFGPTLQTPRYETRKASQTESDVHNALIQKGSVKKTKVMACFKPKDQVYAQSSIESEWNEGTIVKRNEDDNTFHVTWKDGTENLRLHRNRIRTLAAGRGRIYARTKLRIVCPSASKENKKEDIWPMENRVTFAYFKASFDRYPRRKIQAKVCFSPGLVESKKRKRGKKKKNTDKKTTTTVKKKKRSVKRNVVVKKKNISKLYTEYDGVCIHSSTKWRSKIRLLETGKHLQLGLYDTQEEAALTYDIAALASRDVRHLWDLRRKWNPSILTNFPGQNVIITNHNSSNEEAKKCSLSDWQTNAMQALNLDKTVPPIFAEISRVNRVDPDALMAELKDKFDEPPTKLSNKKKKYDGYSLFCKTNSSKLKDEISKEPGFEIVKLDEMVSNKLRQQWDLLSKGETDEWHRKAFLLVDLEQGEPEESNSLLVSSAEAEKNGTQVSKVKQDDGAGVPVPIIPQPTTIHPIRFE